MGIEYQDGQAGKVCRRCGAWKPTEAFRKRAVQTGDGYYNQCRACERAANQSRYYTDLEAGRAHSLRYYRKHRAVINAKKTCATCHQSETAQRQVAALEK
ncbi:MAG: hypothetical protein HC876_16935 [Chloroflexaceae bacterium]|nr:hypothetical protein [Chloroflexaceae bacterium]